MKSKMTYINLFLLISIFNTGLCIMFLFFNMGELFNRIILGPTNQFSDYFFHVSMAQDRRNLYSLSSNVCFPPLAYCMYYFLYRFAPSDVDIMDWEAYKNSDNALTIFVIYNLICAIFLLYVIRSYMKKSSLKYDVILPIALLMSIPFCATSIQRGNAVMLVSITLSLFFLWNDDISKIKQEVALVLLAVAAGFKTYPALCGIIYIKRKEWAKAVRCLIYGIVLYFGPFVFFGGLSGLRSIISNYLSRETAAPRTGTARGVILYFLNKLAAFTPIANTRISVAGELLFIVILLISFFIAKKRWQESLFLCGIMSVCIPSNNMYTAIYFLIPCLMFLSENAENKLKKVCRLEVISCFLLAMIFSLPIYFLLYWTKVYLGTFAMIYLLLIVNIWSVLYNYIRELIKCWRGTRAENVPDLQGCK